MEFLMQFELSIYATLAALMLLMKIYYKKEVYSNSNRLFKAMLFGVIFIMVLEFLSWLYDGKPGNFAHYMNIVFNVALFMFSPLVPSLWVAYIYYKIYGDIEKVRKYLWFQYPLIISVILGFINLITPIVFEISRDTNIFSRLPLLSINFVMIYMMITYSIIITIKERKKLNSTVLIAVLLFVLLPVFGSLLQLYNFGLIVMYPILSLSLIVIYLFMETTSSSSDYLTGLYSRSRFDEVVTSKVQRNEVFSVIMLDLDDYKQFNDEYGHIVGDRVLIMFANLMKQVFGQKALPARYGGDEFVVVIEEENESLILELKIKLQSKISESTDPILKNLKFSYGHSTRTKTNQLDYDALLKLADNAMYENKAVNKNFKRRKEDKERLKEDRKG